MGWFVQICAPVCKVSSIQHSASAHSKFGQCPHPYRATDWQITSCSDWVKWLTFGLCRNLMKTADYRSLFFKPLGVDTSMADV